MFSLIELIKSNDSGAETLDPIGILDIGAMLIDGIQKEYSGLFNQGCARVVGFEPVENECSRLNEAYKNTGMQFLPYFIGDGTRQKFYLTNNSMTSSLYEPNTPLLNLFQNLGELVIPVAEEWVATKRLDDIEELNFPVDYIKIDIQGAELQALESAQNKVLKDVLVIQTEVEWVPLYKNQPLFAELELFLRSQGFAVHKIIGFGTRSFKPTVTHNINVGIQNLWSDVIFVRDFTKLDLLKPQQLLKMATILHEVYHSVDLALIILKEYDRQRQTSLAKQYQEKLNGSSVEQAKSGSAHGPKAMPTDFVSLYSLGVEACNKNNYSSALEYFEAARAINGSFAPLWYNLGIITGKLGRFNEALLNLDQAVKLDPNYKEAINLRKALAAELQTKTTPLPAQRLTSAHSEKLTMGIELQAHNKLEEAEAVFQEILAASPMDAAALFSMGGLEYNRKNLEKALTYFSRALSVKPDFPPLWYNLGIAQQALKQYDKALASYDKALSLNPTCTEVMLNRGAVLVDLRRHKDALLNYEELVKLEPMNDKALCNRGIILSDFKLNDLAIETFERLIAVSPQYDYALGLLSFAKMHACSWNNLEALNQAIIEGVQAGRRVCKSLAFTAISGEPHDHLLCAQTFARHYYPAQQPIWRGEIYDHRKIKIAYISPDFREHPVGHLTAGIFEHHDKENFETIAISLGIDDKSPLRARMLAAFDEFIDARQMRSYDIARLLHSKEVDILVDLAGYTADSRTDILAFRPAPIQVNYLGYSSTMGTDYIDYIIADRHIIPEEMRDCYSEKVVYLPDTYLPTDSAVKIASTLPRAKYGLPESGFVFCSFNHDYKINPPVFNVWMRLLQQIPGSVLWLMKLNESAEKNLRKEAAARGVEPERIVFATRVPGIEDHLARYRAADLFLDTTPCNAHSTTSDVLRAGLPLLTCRGKSFAGRVAAGLLTLVGLPELITENLEDYEKLALQLATKKDMLLKTRTRLEKNLKKNNPFDTDRYCRNLELAFSMMHERYRRGETPDHLTVDEAQIKGRRKSKTSKAATMHNDKKPAKAQPAENTSDQAKTYWPVVIAEDVTVCVQPTVQQMTSYVLLEQEDWFEDEIRFVRAFITPEMNALDIGANHGVYALSMARKLTSGHIWAFEPTVAPGRMLEKSIALNGFSTRITLVHAGLSDHFGSAEIATSANSELNSLYGNSGNKEVIRLETLDEYLEAHADNKPISFVKLDAEGEEVSILRGGQNFFSRQSPLVMFELKHGHEVNHGLIEAFEKLGYGIYRLLNDINILVEFDPSYQDDVLNLFACKPDHADLLSKRNLLARNAEIAEVLPDETATGNDWLQKMQSFPYIRKCETDWLANLAEVPENYLKALSAGIQMHDATLPAATRVFLLNKASALIEDMLKQAAGAHYSVWLLKLHLMHIQNQRRGSASLCGQLMEAFANAATPSWPFIPPCEMFFSRTPQNTVGNWLFEILQEFIEYRQSFSSYFNAEPLKTLTAIIRNNNHDLAIERRFILASKRAGKPALPAQGSPLMNPEQSPNSSIWRQILGTVQK